MFELSIGQGIKRTMIYKRTNEHLQMVMFIIVPAPQNSWQLPIAIGTATRITGNQDAMDAM
jgi:hypothetical protein